jgi:dihydroflavonol-4-reductase
VPGERYILGGENLSLHAILETLGALTGLPAPRVRLPHSLTLAAGHVSEALARLTGREPRVPLEAARSARHPMYFSGERARRELGFESPPAAEALERAVRWFIDTGRARRRVARITLPERTS